MIVERLHDGGPAMPQTITVTGWVFTGRGAEKRSKAVWAMLNAANKRYDMKPDVGVGIWRIQKPSTGLGHDAPYYVVVADNQRGVLDWPECRAIAAPMWEPEDMGEARVFAIRHVSELIKNTLREGVGKDAYSEYHYGLGMVLDDLGRNAGFVVGGG